VPLVAEPVDAWWRRRQWSRGVPVPYAVGEFRAEWASWPVLVRQYHPEWNAGVVLTQVPPAADVLLTWECDVGHVFVATPSEQRSRPGRERRRSVWCPECAVLAQPQRWPVLPEDWPSGVPVPQRAVRTTGRQTLPAAPARSGARAASSSAVPSGAVASTRRGSGRTGRTGGARSAAPRTICPKTPRLPSGESFVSRCAPAPASAVEAELRAALRERLDLTFDHTAIRLDRPFHEHVEVWPDIVLPELRVAIEYDSTGRHGLEHVGSREDSDRRKDRATRAVGWEVVRIRTGRLPALGPWDLQVSGVSGRTVDRLVDVLREVRGPLFVDAYAR
jgi:very-short-patch-repair endonuclease